MGFEFATATRIIFGPGTLQEVAPRAADVGYRAFVVTGRTAERACVSCVGTHGDARCIPPGCKFGWLPDTERMFENLALGLLDLTPLSTQWRGGK